MRSTKIVVTLGPATDSSESLRNLLEIGVDVFRLNASHGTQAEHRARVERVRTIANEIGQTVAFLMDLQGPKIRLGKFQGGGCTLQTGSDFTITTRNTVGTADCACTSYAEFANDVKPGDLVLIADGLVRLQVLETDGVAARCRVLVGGCVSDRKGINLPGVEVSAPSLTQKDLADLAFAIELQVDFVALSFVRKAEDVSCLGQALRDRGAAIPIIAKVEKRAGWENLDAVLSHSDGVMVARGDLGVEMELEQVPHIQKGIIERARRSGKAVITATQMLESMIEHATPTRAEVSDVANAIYDGTDAIMLSGETSVGKYPVEAVKMMARIAEEAESSRQFRAYKDLPLSAASRYPEIVAAAACQAAGVAGVAAIAVFTSSGSSARLVSRLRPAVPIYAFTTSQKVARELLLSYGVHPVLAPEVRSTDLMLAQVERMLLERGWLKHGDGVVAIAGQPIGHSGSTNLLKLHRLGETLA
jgi:pyruvate kinase